MPAVLFVVHRPCVACGLHWRLAVVGFYMVRLGAEICIRAVLGINMKKCPKLVLVFQDREMPQTVLAFPDRGGYVRTKF